MIEKLTCFKCWNHDAVLTYEENRIYKVSCQCGCSYDFEHSSMAAAHQYHHKMLELYGEIDKNEKLRLEYDRLTVELEAERAKNAEYKQAEADKRLLVLPVGIGEKVYITGEYEEVDGTVVRCVDETNLVGFINEDGRQFYLCYDSNCRSCDVEPKDLHLSREAAAAAIKDV